MRIRWTMGSVVALSALLGTARAQTTQYIISTVAGSDAVRDGRPALRALFDSPSGIAFDAAGRLFIADRAANRIRVATPDRSTGWWVTDYGYGTIATFAGVGAGAFSGDGGPATEAHIASPQKITVDAAGNVYFSEAGRVRRVDGNGLIQTVAGGGTQLEVAEGAPATSIALTLTAGVTIDSRNNLYFTELYGGANRNTGLVRRVSPDGKLTTVAGGGDLGLEADGGNALLARLINPGALTMDGEGNLYVVEQGRSCVRRISAEGRISTVAGTGVAGFSGDNGPAAKAQLASIADIALDQGNVLYILDNGNSRVRVVSPDGVIKTVLQYYSPAYAGLAVSPDGHLWLAGSPGISGVEAGSYGPILGNDHSSMDGIAAAETLLRLPAGLAMDSGGMVYYSESSLSAYIRVIDSWGVVRTLAGPGYSLDGSIGDGSPLNRAVFSVPAGLAIDAAGNLWMGEGYRIRRVNRADSIVQTVAGTGVYGSTGDGGPATNAKLDNVRWFSVDPAGNLYLSSPASNTVRMVGSDGSIQAVAGNGTRGFAGDDGLATSAQLSTPAGVASGKDGSLYIADQGNRRIRVVSKSGFITTFAGGGTQTGDGPAREINIPTPSGVAIGPDGELYFTSAAAIYRVSRAGWLERIAGGDLPGYSGDGGPALAARLNGPTTLLVDEKGAILFADTSSHRIRKLTPVGPGEAANSKRSPAAPGGAQR